MDQNHEETNEISCYDYHVSFSPEEVARKEAFYNFTRQDPRSSDRERVSVFYKDQSGAASFIRTQLMLGASRR